MTTAYETLYNKLLACYKFEEYQYIKYLIEKAYLKGALELDEFAKLKFMFRKWVKVYGC